jgi:8-oxo-dGTP pyrophosphatase MutT (NUDIX family)
VPIAPGSPGSPLWDPDAVPAATVVVLRDAPDGLEVLMLKRDQGLSFAGGMWVFPGGRIDPGDHADAGDRLDLGAAVDMEAAARRAAVREAAEEAGIEIDPDALRRWSHWTPPPRQDKRFTTAFFVAPAVDDTAEIVIDDGEIRAHRWARPDQVIRMRDEGEITLAPPTYITLVQLLPHPSVTAALDAADRRDIEHFATRVAVVGDTWIALYHGDVAYEDEDPDPTVDGPRHRLCMDANWRYERTI